MLQGDAASPIRPPCSDSSRLTVETRGVRNHPDPVNGASGPAPSNAPQPSTAAASSCAATGARRLKALRAHEDTWRKRLPTVREAGSRRVPRLSTACAPPRGAALRHLAPPPTRTRAPSPALATRLHGTERILRALVPCLEPTVYLMQSFPTSFCSPLRARRPPPRAPARHPFCAATP